MEVKWMQANESNRMETISKKENTAMNLLCERWTAKRIGGNGKRTKKK